MDVQTFVERWKIASLQKEKSASQSHFLDLCALLNVPIPVEADPLGENYVFERGAKIAGGGDGWADVWYRGHFAWEYKGPGKDLDAAYLQLLRYKDALENPPLMVVSDMDTILIQTNFTNSKPRHYEITLDTLADRNLEHGITNMALLAKLWLEPEWFRPQQKDEVLTKTAAERFATIAKGLHDRQVDPETSAHFLVQMVFCLFAEDIRLLPNNVFTKMIRYGHEYPGRFAERCTEFLHAMNTGGEVAYEPIPHVNGGLFKAVDVPELTKPELAILLQSTTWDWSKIEPAIFGTLFERSLDPSKRSQLGAHYTGRSDIQRVVDPVVMQPLRRRFAEIVQTHGPRPIAGESAPKLTPKQRKDALADINAFLHELETTTVLDPACGSGNFLYVALAELLTLEWEVKEYRALLLGLPRGLPAVTPEQMLGIEIEPVAQQLAQTAIWIGYLQWLHDYNFGWREPVLGALDTIQQRDALLTWHEDGTVTETEWPSATFIIGNPPFVGGNKIRQELGNEYVDTLFRVFDGRVKPFADFVVYWFEKARAQIKSGHSKRAGLLATNSIRGGVNREVLQRINTTGQIYLAWSDEPWILDGAAVRISIIGFDDGTETLKHLNGSPVQGINPDLTSAVDITVAGRLPENAGLCFMGPSAKGPFDIDASVAETMLAQPVNPNNRSNADVVVPVVTAVDIVRVDRGKWTIDFGLMDEQDAALYELPFEHIKTLVYPIRSQNRRESYARKWWQYAEARPGLRSATSGLSRKIVTPGVSKHRIFVWKDVSVLANQGTLVFAREDDYFFGVLHSRAHELWSLRMGTSLEDRPRYTPTTTFETYPFPWPPGQEPVDDPVVQRISAAAKDLDDKRNAWLNPDISPARGDAAAELKKRTLTNLYNTNPTWLRNLHATLDRAVWDAYGWPADERPAEVDEDVVLSRLLALNLERSGE